MMVKYFPLREFGNDSATVNIESGDYRIGPALNNKFGIIDWVVLAIVYVIWLASLPLTWCISFKVVPQYERIVVFRLGRLLPLKGPGLVFIIPCVDKWIKTDMRMRAFSVPPQEVLTIDGHQLKVGADVQYRIADPVKAHGLVKDIDHSLRVSAQSVLNKNLACKKAVDIENERSFLAALLQNSLNTVAQTWGIEIARFEMTHIVKDERKGASKDDDEFQDPMDTIVNLIKGLASSSSSTPLQFGGASLFPSSSSLQPTCQPGPQPVEQSLLQPRELFEMLKVAIDQETAREVDAVFCFDISGESGGQWYLDLKSDPYMVTQETPNQSVDVSFQLTDKLFMDILYGRTTPTEAYFTGKLTITGNTKTALRLETIINKLQEKQ